MLEQAIELGLNDISLWNCINSTKECTKKICILPCYAEYAMVDNNSAWILVFNFEIPSKSADYLEKICVFTMDAETYDVLLLITQ